MVKKHTSYYKAAKAYKKQKGTPEHEAQRQEFIGIIAHYAKKQLRANFVLKIV